MLQNTFFFSKTSRISINPTWLKTHSFKNVVKTLFWPYLKKLVLQSWLRNTLKVHLSRPGPILLFGLILSHLTGSQCRESLRVLTMWRLHLSLSVVHFHPFNSRNTILLATTSSLYLSRSCSRTAASPDISRSSSQQCQRSLELREFRSRSRASEKSPLVFSRALVTLTKSCSTNGEISPHFDEVI